MGNNNSNVLTKEQAKSIADETGFSKAQVFHFYARFKQIDKNGKNWLSRSDFHSQPELSENMISDRIVNAMFGTKDRMEFVDFVRLLATFKPTNKKNEEHLKKSKLKLLFSIYDTEMTGVISKKDMLNLIEDMTDDCENATSEVKGLKINKEVYQDAIFEDILLPWTQTTFRQRFWTYQRDSPLAHKAKFMQQWYHANMPNFIDSSQRPPIPPI
ncbi:hypothetical protein WR25_02406 [Diploscapter pachys]|uniref:EF-hand domain-containing protein n=1 Tax=Diploscapter pachys TaxID=2018661 RepID=A0A2A2JNM5_9BILA|nr:hypothetical protein WR25_02406 [Diploscapter pachys]